MGDIQSLVFIEMDNGPFHLTTTEHVNRKYDKPTGEMVIKKKNLRELRSELAAARDHIDVNLIKGKREKIVLLASSAGIALERRPSKKSYEVGLVNQKACYRWSLNAEELIQ